MKNKKFIGTFQNEEQVLNKIEELKIHGWSENDIYIVTNDTDQLSMIRGQTDVDLHSAEVNWLDRFMTFLSGDEPVKTAFYQMGFNEDESTYFYDELKKGGILLYVDKEYGQIFDNEQIALSRTYTDPTIGANILVPNADSESQALNQDGIIVGEDFVGVLKPEEKELLVSRDRIHPDEVAVERPFIKEEQRAFDRFEANEEDLMLNKDRLSDNPFDDLSDRN